MTSSKNGMPVVTADWTFPDDVREAAEKAARDIAALFPNDVELDDAAQDALLHLVEHREAWEKAYAKSGANYVGRYVYQALKKRVTRNPYRSSLRGEMPGGE